jgi:putative aminopeptidase FrvX
VSFPIRYMHTTVEMGHLRDLDQIAQVFAGFCEGMTGSERFAPDL